MSVFGFENCGGTWGLSGAAENGSRENGPNIRDVRPVRRMRSCSATTIGISNRVNRVSLFRRTSYVLLLEIRPAFLRQGKVSAPS